MTQHLSTLGYLAVDDDLNTRQILTLLLTRVLGSSQVAVFEDSEEFAERVQNLPFIPAVVLLDIAIGPIDGYSMLKLLREKPEYAQTKVIALTARVMSDEIERMRTAGFDGLISKPIISPVFADLMTRIVKGEPVWYVA